ncbi:ema family member protein [Theileria equi strain WA]|uniref:Ema family member protein n=1 Tax=Theileria equi strain WA TaxID=1537102 RepID=L1L9R3_THEEQ|nr:ema family member protein [Theileria equi strain WA]EKX71989.1 ema family member protein [Theileria equi strain WA]|eukprot:XP_004831441.1 ema family member protein [Theileria equi strain WA]
MVKSLLRASAVVFLALSGVFAKGDVRYLPVTVDISNYMLNQPNLFVKVDSEEVVFNAQEGHAIERVVNGDEVIRTFDLSQEAPKTVVKHIDDNYVIVSINVEPSLNLAYKHNGDRFVEMDITEFYETVFFKGLENVVVDLDAFSTSGYFSSSDFGPGKMYEFEIPSRRISKLVAGNTVLVSGVDELLLGVVVHVNGDRKVATVWYVFKPDGRIKEIFFQLINRTWTRVDTKTAAEALHFINPNFSVGYKPIYDGFSVACVSFTLIAIAFAVLY